MFYDSIDGGKYIRIIGTMNTAEQTKPTFTIHRFADDTDDFALYEQYQSQTGPQGVHLEIDWETRDISVAVDGEIGGGVPFRVWHGLAQRYSLPPGILPAEANSIMEQAAEYAENMADRFEPYWDGSNWRGRWAESDDEVEDEGLEMLIERAGENAQTVQVYDAPDWFADWLDAVDDARALRRDNRSEWAKALVAKWEAEAAEAETRAYADGPVLLLSVEDAAESAIDDVLAEDEEMGADDE